MTIRNCIAHLTVIVLLATTAAAQAPVTLTEVEIHLTGNIARKCKTIEPLILILNDDRGDVAATPTGECIWKAKPGTYSATSQFSLRLGFARTDCRKVDQYRTPPRLEFRCCDGTPSQTVSLAVDPTITSSYLRRVPASEGGVACVESGLLKKADNEVKDVQFSKEKLVLQLGLEKADRNDPGMPIDVRALQKYATGPGALHIERNGVPEILSEQRAQGNASSPTLSPVAIDLDVRKLKQLEFKSLDLTVK